ncbi:MAG: hypothetical protein WC729_20835 [Sphingomonas sp.]|jgi:hypothetical protein|uniref:hypothetical protein n=1 Tax=Sphingomonas sp. TaxID=28214 RepID=UPI0035643405
MRILTAIAAVALTLSPAVAQERIKTADLETVSRRGAQLYAFDQAAWHTTDTMLAKGLPREKMAAIRGWVVEPHGETLTVTYYGFEGAKPYAIYAADYAGGKVVAERVPSTTEALSAQGERMALARAAASETPPKRCVERSYNTVVLPPLADGTIPVYLLTPMVAKDAYPFGGHHEVDIGPDGRVAATRDFTNSCLTIAQPADSVMGFVTHLLDPHPTEIHVYLSLWMGKPIAVGTGKDVAWMVEGAKVSPLSLKDGAKKR